MSKWIYIDTDDTGIGQTVMTALTQAGYVATEAPDPAEKTANVAIFCHPTTENRLLKMGNLTLDLDNVSATLESGETIHFTPIEFSVLGYLIKNRHRAISRDELLPAVWGFENDAGTRVADDTVKRLRRKLTDTAIRIETVWGYGFKVTETA